MKERSSMEIITDNYEVKKSMRRIANYALLFALPERCSVGRCKPFYFECAGWDQFAKVDGYRRTLSESWFVSDTIPIPLRIFLHLVWPKSAPKLLEPSLAVSALGGPNTCLTGHLGLF